jgi:hypothetical protein
MRMKSSEPHSEGQSCPSSTCRPQFGLSTLLQTMALICVLLAIYRIHSPYSLAVLAVMGFTWIFGCPKTKRAVALITPCFLLPYVWMLLIDYPWGDYRWHWTGLWACLPGLLFSRIFTNSESIWYGIAAAFTAIRFLGTVSLIRFWPLSRWWTFAVVLLLNLWNSFVLYQMYWV